MPGWAGPGQGWGPRLGSVEWGPWSGAHGGCSCFRRTSWMAKLTCAPVLTSQSMQSSETMASRSM